MAQNEKLDEIIDEKAFKQLDELLSKLGIAQTKFAEVAKSAIEMNNAIATSKGINDFNSNTAKANNELVKLQKSQEKVRLEEIRLQQAREKAFDSYEKKLAKQQADEEKARLSDIRLQQQREKSIDNYNKQLAKSENLYNKVQAKVNSLSLTYNNLAIKQQLGLKLSTSEEAQLLSLEKRLNMYQTALIKVDSQIQKNGRNVGNYASGFNPLNNAIGQISRELPNFGQSFSVGVLSLTNNIGALQDSISGIIAQNKILISQGQPVKSVFSQVLGSVLTFNTGLFIAIGLFSAYSKEIGEFVSDLFTFEKRVSALDQSIAELTRSQDEYNKVLLEGSKGAQSEIVSLNVTRKAIENVNIPLNERNALVNDLQEKYPKYLGNLSNEEILAGDVGTKYLELKDALIATALARAAQDKIAENSSRILDNESKIIDARKQRIKLENELTEAEKTQRELDQRAASSQTQFGSTGSILGALSVFDIKKDIAKQDKIIFNTTTDTNKLNADNLRLYGKINSEIEKNGTGILGNEKEQEKAKEKLIAISRDLEKFRLETNAQANKLIADNEKTNQDDRFNALEQYLQEKQALIDLNKSIELANNKQKLNEDLSQEDLTAENIKNIKINAANEEKLIKEKAIAESNNLDKEGSAIALKIFQDQADEKQKIEIKAAKNRLTKLEIERDDALLLLDEEFNLGKKSKEDYEIEKLKIQKYYNKKAFDEQVKQIQSIIDLQNSLGQDTTDAEAKLAALKIKYANDVTDAKLKNAEKEKEASKQLHETEKELAQEAADLVVQIVNQSFENRAEKIDKEVEKLNEKADFDKEQINDSLLSEEEKQIKLAQIEAKRAFDEEQLNNRKKKIQLEQARFQKAVSIFQIGIDTATAIMKTYAEFGFPIGVPLAIAQAAIGAVQIAAVAATPLPKFEHGGEMKKTGLALFGEVGTELRIDPDGSMSLTPDKPTIGEVKAGTQFISNKDLLAMISNPLALNFESKKTDNSEVVKYLDKIEKKISSGSQTTLNITKNGWSKTTKSANGWTKYIDRL